MREDTCEMHHEDDKVLSEKNKKRIVKTHAQVQALEKFYNEHKYPSESMKIQLAESIGLTEKQVSGWFCHRRLKDKKLINGENHATVRQDRSSGVIQDRGSGHRQDSCGSTKQGDDKNLDTREVESGRLTSKEFSAADLTYEHDSHYAGNYNHTNDDSSGSSSSLRNVPPNYQNGDPSDAATSRYLIPKLPSDVKGVKTRPGPSGYLKLKGRLENPAITAVKRQLGKHYRDDGPPLGVEFDSLPPGAFESSMQEPVEENYHTGEDVRRSPDLLNVRQNSKFCKGSEYLSSMASFNSDIDGTIRDIPGVGSRDEYGSRRRPGVEVTTMDTVPRYSNLQAFGGKLREKRAESWSQKYNDVSARVAFGEDTENENSNLTARRNGYHSSVDKGLRGEVIKDDKIYTDRRMINEHQMKIPIKNDTIGKKRLREEFPHQQPPKATLMVDTTPQNYQVIRSATEMPSSFSEDDESGGTSSSVD
ncbi:homeobox-DDT domain protein RLT2 isoform X3 [Salvia miltiorrhiza]|uniref:homeobox-DDT domain protein RLT2 isoform X3 n=1 Tax=Salvia miltiorrhiza TaxID=226208 RepID=UPI0025AC419A|nr:homeobox-DDT domain protein RLT2 isoform X3 [Salvia miltiorrhiza]